MRAVGFPVHIGSAACASASKTAPPTSCRFPNRATVTFAAFDARHDIVIADVAALLQGANVDVNTPNTAPGCMSEPTDPDCAPIFSALGLTGDPQRFFRVKKPT
jgi:hypothetical protein